jgi:hypothetical protein
VLRAFLCIYFFSRRQQRGPLVQASRGICVCVWGGGGGSEATIQDAGKWVGGCRGVAGGHQTERRWVLLLAGMGTVAPRVISVGIRECEGSGKHAERRSPPRDAGR